MENEIYLTQFKCNQGRDRDDLGLSKNKSHDYQKFVQVSKHKQNYGFQIMCEEYYTKKKVKPGMLVYKTIIEIQEQRQNATINKFPFLNIFIPQTLVFHENSYKLITVCNDRIVVKNNPNLKEFVLKNNQQRDYQTLSPAFHSKIYNGIEISHTITLSCDISNKLIPNTQNQVVQKYVVPYAGTANLLRLFFHPKRVASTRKNCGLKFTNHVILDDNILMKKHKLVSNCLVNTQKDSTYTTALIYGKALQRYQAMAQSLTDYLELAHKVKISQMIIDFIIDQYKNIHFHELKSVKSAQLNNIWDKADEQTLQYLIKEKMNENQCPLCLLYYSKTQIERIVTGKLIWQLLLHLQMRGVNLDYYGFKKIKPDNRLFHVCQLCYNIILAQHKLINCSNDFSKILNMNPEKVNRVPYIKPQVQPMQFKKQKQWRLFFFIENIRKVRIENQSTHYQLEIQFKNIKHNFFGFTDIKRQSNTKNQCSFNSENRYMDCRSLISKPIKPLIKRTKLKLAHYDKNNTNCSLDNTIHSIPKKDIFKTSKLLNQSQTTYQTSPTEIDSIRRNCIQGIFDKASKSILKINEIKLYLMYAELNQNNSEQIKNFLSSATLNINLNLQGKIYSGNSQILTTFSCKPNQCSRISTQVYLFDEKYHDIAVQLTVGLIFDGQRCVYDKDLFQHQDIKIGNQKLKTCDPLPEQWMQIWKPDIQQHKSSKNKDLQIKGKNKITKIKLNKTLINNF